MTSLNFLSTPYHAPIFVGMRIYPLSMRYKLLSLLLKMASEV